MRLTKDVNFQAAYRTENFDLMYKGTFVGSQITDGNILSDMESWILVGDYPIVNYVLLGANCMVGIRYMMETLIQLTE